MRHLLVRDEMRTDTVTVLPGAQLTSVVSKFLEHPGTSIFVIDEQQRLQGVIASSQSRTILTDASSFEAFIIARDLMEETDFPTVNPTDTLADVMKRLAHYRGEVPVIDAGRLVGVIWPEDVLQRYTQRELQRDMASSMVSSVSQGPRAEPIPAIKNTSMLEMPVPVQFVGQSLGSLDIRNRYQVTILLIKQQIAPGQEELLKTVPSADYVFRSGDILLVMGPNDQLRRLAGGDTHY